eukprot:13966-Chlamydomonas_euryale.AAC.6
MLVRARPKQLQATAARACELRRLCYAAPRRRPAYRHTSVVPERKTKCYLVTLCSPSHPWPNTTKRPSIDHDRSSICTGPCCAVHHPWMVAMDSDL